MDDEQDDRTRVAFRLVLAAVFLLSLAVLGYHVNQVGLAETYVDPVAKIPAQDEAVYASTAMHMAQSGGWLTPMFLGRYAFYKPPLLYWVAGLSAKLFGPSLWALRLPSLLAGSAIATLLFAWMWGARSLAAAVASSLLLVSDRLFHVLARLVLTDMLVVLFIVIAMAAVHWDPELTRRRSLWILGGAVGAAIMTKSVAGLLPLMMLAGSRIGLKRFAQVCGIAALVAAPWHVYQLAVHTRWFWTEYIVTENFTWAVAAPEQSTQENQLWYYLKRLAVTDPLLCVAAIGGIAAAIRGRNRLLAAWIAVVFLAFLAFGYRNTSYLLLLIPALCLLGGHAPLPWVFAVLAAIKLATLPYHSEHPMPSVAGLQSYASLHRSNDLIIVAPDDEFVSSTLPLRHVRYCFFKTNPDPARLPLDFRYLGVTVSVAEFNRLEVELPIFRERLAGFGLDSTSPVATVILAKDPEELRGLIAAHPESDFSLPDGFIQFADEQHTEWERSAGRSFLLGH